MLPFVLSYLAGLATPLGAVCVLPLYPGYIAFLAGLPGERRVLASPAAVGAVVTAGVIAGMFGFGLVTAGLFGLSVSAAIGVVAPALYAVLAVVGAAMLLGVDVAGRLPGMQAPTGGNPAVSALLFGAFFGLIALPCNPGPIILLFALSASAADFAANLLHFLLFALGMATPLFALSLIPAGRGRSIAGLFARHHRTISRATGLFLLAVAVSALLAA